MSNGIKLRYLSQISPGSPTIFAKLVQDYQRSEWKS